MNSKHALFYNKALKIEMHLLNNISESNKNISEISMFTYATIIDCFLVILSNVPDFNQTLTCDIYVWLTLPIKPLSGLLISVKP